MTTRAGGGVPRDRNLAAYWLARAVQRGHQEAEWNLKSHLPGLRKIKLNDAILVRKNPDATAEIISTSDKDETAYELARLEGWVEIWLKDGNTIGYVSAEQAPDALAHRASSSSSGPR